MNYDGYGFPLTLTCCPTSTSHSKDPLHPNTPNNFGKHCIPVPLLLTPIHTILIKQWKIKCTGWHRGKREILNVVVAALRCWLIYR